MSITRNLLLGALILSLGLLSLIDTNNPNPITGLANLNDTQCGTCSNWTDIACGQTELDTFGCSPEEMYQTRECSIVYNPTGSPFILKLTPIQATPTGFAILSSNETCSERCVISTICSNLPPDEPTSPFPENNVNNIPVNIELSWDALDPNNDVLIFDLYFGDLGDIDLLAADLNDSSYDLNNLENGKFYEWKVVAKDNLTETSSQVWQFRTINEPQKQVSSPSKTSSSSSNSKSQEQGSLIVEESSNNEQNKAISNQGLVVEETPKNAAKTAISNLLTGSAITSIISRNNVIFQLISIILTISILVLFVKKKV